MIDESGLHQAEAVANNIMTQAGQEYHQQEAYSNEAQQEGNQLQQQADVANQNATEASQKASQIGDIMATTGSSGNLYQQNLTSQNQIVSYDSNAVSKLQQQEAQAQGREQQAISQIQDTMGGTRGLSATGVQTKVQSIQNNANNTMNTLGNLMLTEQQKQSIAETNASNEANAEYKQEGEAEQSYTEAAQAYTTEASNYATMAKTEFNVATLYDAIASYTLTSATEAASNAMAIGMQTIYAQVNKALTSAANASASLSNQLSSLYKSQTTMQNQENDYNQQMMSDQISQEKQYMATYKTMVNAGVYGSTLNKVFTGTPLSVS